VAASSGSALKAATSASHAKDDAEKAKSFKDKATQEALNAHMLAAQAKEDAKKTEKKANEAKSSEELAAKFAKNAEKSANSAKTAADKTAKQAQATNTNAENAKKVASQALAKAAESEKTANAAKTTASNAEKTANTANNQSTAANNTANDAKIAAGQALAKATESEKTAKDAKTTASGAAEVAKVANNKSTTANNTAKDAEKVASQALAKAAESEKTANAAKTTASNAEKTANTANNQSTAANNTANDAKIAAGQALAKATESEKTAKDAKTTASGAAEVAKVANNKSTTANNTAKDAEKVANQAIDKAEEAKHKAIGAGITAAKIEAVAKEAKKAAEGAAKQATQANDAAHKAVETALANKCKSVESLQKEIVETEEKVEKITKIISGFTKSHPSDNHNDLTPSTATVEAANRLFPNDEKARRDYLKPNNSNEQVLVVQQIERQIVKTIKTRINKKSMLNGLASNLSGINSGSVAENLDIWVGSAYQYSKEDSFNNQDYYKVSTTLFSVGVDANLTESTLLGLSYGQSKSNSNIYGGATGVKKGQDDINSQDVAVYISNDDNQLNSSFTLLYTKNEHESKDADKTIPKYNSEVFGFNIDINRAFDISRSAVNNNLIPELILNVQMGYAKIDVDAHQSKFDSTNVEKKESNLFNLTIGPAISKKVKLHNNTQLNYKLGMGYTHIIANDSTDDRLTLMVNNNNISRVVINRKPSAHNLNLDATFDLQFNSNFNLELNADYTIGDHLQEYGASLIARYKF
jgi:myosin heavy subunit